MITRSQEGKIKTALKENKIIWLYGPPCVGKKTLIESVCGQLNLSWTHMSATNIDNRTLDVLDVLVLDDAEYCSNLQEIIEEQLKSSHNYRIIISSSFLPEMNEEFHHAMIEAGLCFKIDAPLYVEYAKGISVTTLEKDLLNRLIYGLYPDAITNPNLAETHLLRIWDSSIKTHFASSQRVNKKEPFLRLVRLLAFNIGAVTTYHDLGVQTGLDNETVQRYVDLLEKAGLVISLPVMSNGNRYELTKSHCVYFLDNGLRNAAINNFNPESLRNDMPELWKNFLISERVKALRVGNQELSIQFWKTHTNQSMDLIEKRDEVMFAYKMDWFKKKTVKIPNYFLKCYPESKTRVLNRNTFLPFLMKN